MAKTVILYFSKTGTTKRIAEIVADKLEADLYPIQEAVPYSSEDLDWTIPSSRANKEQHDAANRPAYQGELPNLAAYDQVIIGHPIWWGIPPRIIQTVVNDLDLSGKCVASFGTSAESTYQEAQELMNNLLHHPSRGRILRNERDVADWLKVIDF